MRKHRAESDFIDNPEYLWSTTSFQGQRGGLRAHILHERGNGVAAFTDVLFILNAADARRVTQSGAWAVRASRILTERFNAFCEREGFELLYPSRAIQFRFLADQGREMFNQGYGLGPGEYITSLLPNLYAGPGPRSRPTLSIHLNLPGIWQDYKEVGRMYADQILFTLGRHWLDNFHHQALQEPGLYRLQQHPNGTLVHTISPDLQDRYLVRADTVEGGASVLTIAEHNGRPMAYLVLSVVDSNTVEISRSVDAAAPQSVAPNVVAIIEDSPPPPLPSQELPARPGMLPLVSVSMDLGPQKTVVPGALEGRICTLRECGALLQKVHFNNFMEGYDVYIGPNGQIATQCTNPQATLLVRGNRVTLMVGTNGLKCNGRVLPSGALVPLEGLVEIEVDGHHFQYRHLAGVRSDGWPYLGELRRPPLPMYLDFGSSFRIGRDRRCRVRLPDEAHNDNIQWLPSVGSGTTIRSRTGDIPKSRFYTDSIMVASEHAEIDLSAEPTLRSLARHCFSYIRRKEQVISLFPREGSGSTREVKLEPGDEILVGNCLFQVTWPPVVTQVAAATLPPTPLIPSADGISLPAAQLSTSELPPAAGLGEVGPSPRPLPLQPPSYDSILGPLEVPVANVPPPRTPVKVAVDPFTEPSSDRLRPIERPAAQPIKPPPPMLLPDEPVVAVDEAQWTLEMGRPARLVQRGWMVSGEVTVGNHLHAALVIPEVRSFAEQPFMILDYFRMSVRGRKGRIQLLQPGEARLIVDQEEQDATEDLNARMFVVRRDKNLEPDFEVEMSFVDQGQLPDPRARFLRLHSEDPMAQALFTRGFPLRAERRLQLGPIEAAFFFDGVALRVSDYLSSYRSMGSMFQPFFLGDGEHAFRTFPEDGSPVLIPQGHYLIFGNAIYQFVSG